MVEAKVQCEFLQDACRPNEKQVLVKWSRPSVFSLKESVDRLSGQSTFSFPQVSKASVVSLYHASVLILKRRYMMLWTVPLDLLWFRVWSCFCPFPPLNETQGFGNSSRTLKSCRWTFAVLKLTLGINKGWYHIDLSSRVPGWFSIACSYSNFLLNPHNCLRLSITTPPAAFIWLWYLK